MIDSSVYTSYLPSISVEFQDGSFLDLDDILSFTMSRTEDVIPVCLTILDVNMREQQWYSIKSIAINGQPGVLVSYEKFPQEFDMMDFGLDDGDDGGLANSNKQTSASHYAKLIVQHLFPDNSFIKESGISDLDGLEMDEGEINETESKDIGTVFQCERDSS